MTKRTVLALPAGQPPGVLWAAPLFEFTGYADEARNFVIGLRAAGTPLRAINVTHVNSSFVDATEPAVLGALIAAEHATIGPSPILVEHAPGGALNAIEGPCFHVARTMFETWALPPTWIPRLNEMDEIWVPSEFNVETFLRAGVTAPIFVVPGGVDAATFRPGLDPLDIPGLRGTVFLSVFEWSLRKGWDVLLSAWARAFAADDDVTLLLRVTSFGDRGGGSDGVDAGVDDFLSSIGRSRADVAPIVCLADAVPDMPRLYATADAYVGPSRGEGWGRPFMEAMACGLPVIATRWSGNLAFMDDDNSLLLEINGLEQANIAPNLPFYHDQLWACPSVDHLVDLLRRIADDPVAARALGQRARSDVEQRWTWPHAVAAARERIADIQGSFRQAAAPRPGDVKVRWVGDQFAHHSLSLVNRELCTRLVYRAPVALEVMTTETPELAPGGERRLAALADRVGPVLAGPPDVEVRHQWPPDWTPPEHGAWVVIQPWEYGGLPDAWVDALADVDEVWCPTEYVRSCYILSGVPADRVRVVSNGVDATRFTPAGATYPLATTKGTKFLFLGGTIGRKGIDVLLQSYVDAFSGDDDVCLVVKSTGAATFYRDSSRDALIRDLARVPGTPEIELIDGDLDPDELAALYRACDVLVHPYRGEGFALPVAEAMASGLAVIVTAYGACLDYCDEDTAYLVPARLQRIEMSPPSSLGNWWAEPDAAALTRTLRHVHAHPLEARERGVAARQRVTETLSWDSAADLASARLVEIAARRPVRLRPRGPATEMAPGAEADAVGPEVGVPVPVGGLA